MTTPFESYPRVTTTFTIVGVVIRYSYLLIAAIVKGLVLVPFLCIQPDWIEPGKVLFGHLEVELG